MPEKEKAALGTAWGGNPSEGRLRTVFGFEKRGFGAKTTLCSVKIRGGLKC